jgi:Ca2+ transporting ATPase
VLFAGHKLLDVDYGVSSINVGASVHFTVIFNSFVLMTLCNEINARKIHGQRNVFEGIHRNFIFLVIWVATLVGQVGDDSCSLLVIIQWLVITPESQVSIW